MTERVTSPLENRAQERSKVQFVVSAPCADLKKLAHLKTIPEEVK